MLLWPLSAPIQFQSLPQITELNATQGLFFTEMRFLSKIQQLFINAESEIVINCVTESFWNIG
ncbi:hypothetical protein HMPREF0201_03374 [Cedecea davisae DSM 4568]|uniref:Uncharacterized protein n=1 Tax=Cedecea davisae DSM 4568 TaxID=566551 RepID=S3INM3_9ENTR|nr:hypothetical protein HMPREF0201_03374 [Cedecea davisae DSM 4568]